MPANHICRKIILIDWRKAYSSEDEMTAPTHTLKFYGTRENFANLYDIISSIDNVLHEVYDENGKHLLSSSFPDNDPTK